MRGRYVSGRVHNRMDGQSKWTEKGHEPVLAVLKRWSDNLYQLGFCLPVIFTMRLPELTCRLLTANGCC